MIDYNQHSINSTYNQLIASLVVWQYLTNKVKADTEQGYKVVKNKEKLDKITSNILELNNKGLTKEEIAKAVGCGVATVYRVLKNAKSA